MMLEWRPRPEFHRRLALVLELVASRFGLIQLCAISHGAQRHSEPHSNVLCLVGVSLAGRQSSLGRGAKPISLSQSQSASGGIYRLKATLGVEPAKLVCCYDPAVALHNNGNNNNGRRQIECCWPSIRCSGSALLKAATAKLFQKRSPPTK